MGARLAFIDNLKAIAIVLVVAGHAPGLPQPARELIFGCHVPLFFFAAGFLAAAPASTPAAATGRRVLHRLLRPYAGFFLLSWGWWLATRAHGNSAARYVELPWWDPWVDFALGYGSYVNPTLWFFPCLALVCLAHHAAARRLRGTALAALSLALAAALVLAWPAEGASRVPWQLDTALVALAFHALGHVARERGLAAAPEGWPRTRRAALALGGAALYAALALANPGVDLAQMRFGAHPTLYLPVAALGIATTVCVAHGFAGNRVSAWLAANTLYIFPLHWLMFRAFTGVGIVLFGLPRDFKEASWLIGVAYTLLALALCVPAAALLRRGLPRLTPRGKEA